MAFVKNGLGVTISQKLVMKAFANDESRPLEPGRSRIIGLAFVNNELGCDEDIVEYLKDDVVFCSEKSPVLWHIWHENKNCQIMELTVDIVAFSVLY